MSRSSEKKRKFLCLLIVTRKTRDDFFSTKVKLWGRSSVTHNDVDGFFFLNPFFPVTPRGLLYSTHHHFLCLSTIKKIDE